MTMTDDELYALFVTAGFPRDHAGKDGPEDLAAYMVAIALRESGGDPYAYNGDEDHAQHPTGDQSYGLVQINWKVPQIMATLIDLFHPIYMPEMLFNPRANAKAAFILYAGNRRFLDTLWYIDRPGVARDRFLARLPRAQAAAARYQGTAPPPAH